MNEKIVHHVLQAALDCGVKEFVICAGMRNSPFVEALRVQKDITTYYWPEERSAGFFAFGRCSQTKCPTAVIVTSGTAAAELLPAAMNAHYLSIPLLLITADRPQSFRGSGAPQSAEQMELFGTYTSFSEDITTSNCHLSQWDQRGTAHLNVCLEEPQSQPHQNSYQLKIDFKQPLKWTVNPADGMKELNHFLSEVAQPLVIIGTLPESCHEILIPFLLNLGAPLFLEAISGLREEPRLQHLRIRRTDKILESAKKNGYPIDGILRIGGIPTHRIWRDLEYLKDQIAVCHITENPFSGLSWHRKLIYGPIKEFISHYQLDFNFSSENGKRWLQTELEFERNLLKLFEEEPNAEVSLVHTLSKEITIGSHIYLGNSMPVREWDMAATNNPKDFSVSATRGSLNGIDGQISTFLGLCQQQKENWAILGDLTALYDMVGPWIIPQLPPLQITIAIINNGGGKIFERFSPHKEMLNCHNLSFEPLAKMWGLSYSRWETIPTIVTNHTDRIIEIIPDELATSRFWNKYNKLVL